MIRMDWTVDSNFIRDRVDCYEVVVGENEPKKPDMVKFKNYEKAIDMLHRHITSDKESLIVMHADVDMDGVGCAYIMNTFIRGKSENCRCKACINKDKVHGVSEKHINYFNNQNPSLVIIMDSSSNALETIESLNCDVLVIDHHELNHDRLVGKTVGGEYVIVNNVVDNGEDYKAEIRMSGALVTYEILRQYQSKFESDNFLEDKMLYQWVGVTLLTDAILTGNERNQWYMNKTVHSVDTEAGLNTMMNKINKYALSLDKTFINYKLAPVFNRAIRGGGSAKALNIALNEQSEIDELDVYKQMQDSITDRVMYTLTGEIRSGVEEIKEVDIIEKEDYCVCKLDDEIPRAYAGLVATKILGLKSKNSIAGKIEDGIINGSFRGKADNIDYRGIALKHGFFAEGHHNAFGIKVPLDKLDELMTEMNSIKVDSKPYLTAGFMLDEYKGKYHVNNLDEFKKAGMLIRLALANSSLSTKESINIVIANPFDLKPTYVHEKFKEYNIMGLECVCFEELKTEFLNIYVEFDREFKAYVKNRWS